MIAGTVSQNTVKLSGKLDETTQVEELFALFQSAAEANPHADGQVIFDFGDCQMANSIGISIWINFLKSKSICAKYCNVPEWLVAQFNQLDELLVNFGGVDSVLAPYYCDETSDTTFQVIDTQNLKELRLKVESDQFCELSIAGQTFVPDFEAKEYFDFLFRMEPDEGAA